MDMPLPARSIARLNRQRQVDAKKYVVSFGQTERKMLERLVGLLPTGDKEQFIEWIGVAIVGGAIVGALSAAGVRLFLQRRKKTS